jgi:hypothetical protein
MFGTKYTWRYYMAVFSVAIGASFQFYSFGVVNPPATIVTKWMSDVYASRGQALSAASLTFLWSATTAIIAIGACIGSLLTRTIAENIGLIE